MRAFKEYICEAWDPEENLGNESLVQYFRVKSIERGSVLRLSNVGDIDFGPQKVRNIGKVMRFVALPEPGWWEHNDYFYHESWLEPVE